MDPYEREEQALHDAYARGEMTNAELNRALNDLARDYREDAHEAARDAYERELDRW